MSRTPSAARGRPTFNLWERIITTTDADALKEGWRRILARNKRREQVAAQEEWERAYDEAMRWRDWQTCEILIDERAASDWYVPEEAE